MCAQPISVGVAPSASPAFENVPEMVPVGAAPSPMSTVVSVSATTSIIAPVSHVNASSEYSDLYSELWDFALTF